MNTLRLFGIFLFSLLLIGVPLQSFAALDVDQCDDEEELNCICQGSSASPFPYGFEEDADEYCFDLCERVNASGDYGTADVWKVQCTVDDQLTSIGIGRMEGVSTDQEEEDQGKSLLGETPVLGISIPGLDLENTDPNNWLGAYVKAVYAWLLAAGALIAILMFMIAGLQWMMARGDASKISQAKGRLANATFGLALLFGAYTIGFLIDPNTTVFDSLNIGRIDPELYSQTSGEEGAAGGADAADCSEALRNAKEDGSCELGEELRSPTRFLYSCNYHFSTENYNYAKIRSVDYPANFGSPAYAPISGTITYIEGTAAAARAGSRCGNKIRIIGDSGSVTLCHMKDFLDEDGRPYANGSPVSAGDHIGHVGGVCGGNNAPKEWSQSKHCTVSGTLCDGPYDSSDCNYQHYYESGNTSGAHVHLSFNYGGDLLNCHE